MSRYDEWMKRQRVEYQDDVLGVKQATMFREGRVSLRRYTSRRGDALTIQQARRRDMLSVFDEGRFPTIALVNKATTKFEVDMLTLSLALQKYLDKFFVPVWGFPAQVVVTDDAVPGTWTMLFADDSDEASALGFHDIAKNGDPVAKVFVRDTLKNGGHVSTTASHELAEMLIDPSAQLWAQDMRTGLLHAYEVADAVEGDEFLVDGVWMSNFVHPEFFESFHAPNSKQFDHLSLVRRPFETLRNGYQIVMENGEIFEVFGSKQKEAEFAKEDRAMHRSEYRKASKTAGM